MRLLIQVALNGIAVLVASWLVPGIDWQGGILYLLLTGLVIGLINLLIKPLVTLLALPFIVLTLGLFYLVINGAMLMLAGSLLQGLTVQGCFPAIVGGLVIGVFNLVVAAIGKD